jgi:hypothetical protein
MRHVETALVEFLCAAMALRMLSSWLFQQSHTRGAHHQLKRTRRADRPYVRFLQQARWHIHAQTQRFRSKRKPSRDVRCEKVAGACRWSDLWGLCGGASAHIPGILVRKHSFLCAAVRAAAEPHHARSTKLKRYRVLTLDFDTRATLLRLEIDPSWHEGARQSWRQTQDRIRAALVQEFGDSEADAKLANFIDIGPRPFSILAFHNRFAAQVRSAFVIGSYYPALTGAGALGERILNHLLRALREDFAHTTEYRKVARKESFDRWEFAIDTLSSWNVLLPEAAEAFRQLSAVRNRTIHFHPATDTNDRTLALDAIRLLDQIINAQFATMGLHPWFIPDTAGESFIRLQWENQPFVRKIYLPNCIHVGPAHRFLQVTTELVVQDSSDYPTNEIADEEYAALRKASLQA